ncbi:MAG: cyclase family protein [Actinomycetota bacterium]|nr:cyclase family protein [Actinomycetota bacterium]
MAATEQKSLEDLLGDLPKNWGRWGDDDEIGALNFLDAREVLRGVQHIKQGKVFTCGLPIGSPGGDPVWPGRTAAMRLMTQDRSHYVAGKKQPMPGGLEYADDVITAFLQGSSQFDALGHTWYGSEIYNGYSAETTTGGMEKCGVDKLAQHGVVGRGVLIDMARHRSKDALETGETFTVEDLEAAAEAQGVSIESHDNLCIRTGWLNVFYEKGPEAFYGDQFVEPGLTFSPELVRWFHEREIVSLSTDTIANEVTMDPNTGIVLPLHAALMRNLGVLFSEIIWFENLATDCAEDGQWSFLYAAAPINIVGGTGAPVNPIIIK